jgi:hypothetical protein
MWNNTTRAHLCGGKVEMGFKIPSFYVVVDRCPEVRATLDEVHPSYWVKMGLERGRAVIRKRGIGPQRLSKVLFTIHNHNSPKKKKKQQRPILSYNHGSQPTIKPLVHWWLFDENCRFWKVIDITRTVNFRNVQ